MVSLCGSFTNADVSRLADRFSAMGPGQPGKYRKTVYSPSVVLKRKATEQDHFCLTWPGLPEGHEERFAWQVLSMVLGGGMSSRLFQTIREKHGLCYSISSFTASFADTGIFGISTAVGRESEEKALSLVRQEIDRLLDSGITPQELSRSREQIKSGVVLSMESTSARMNRLGSAMLYQGRCLTADEIIERYNTVTAEDVLTLARRTFVPEGLALSALGRLAPEGRYIQCLNG